MNTQKNDCISISYRWGDKHTKSDETSKMSIQPSVYHGLVSFFDNEEVARDWIRTKSRDFKNKYASLGVSKYVSECALILLLPKKYMRGFKPKQFQKNTWMWILLDNVRTKISISEGWKYFFDNYLKSHNLKHLVITEDQIKSFRGSKTNTSEAVRSYMLSIHPPKKKGT